MKYIPLNNQLFIDNRQKLITKMKPCAVAIFNSNDIMPTNGDGTMSFRQNNDLFYFSGIDQEESILVICPTAFKKEYREILFLKETNELIEIWEGHKYTKEEAMQISGIDTVLWLSDFEQITEQLIFESEYIYLNTNEHIRSSSQVQTRNDRFILQTKEKFPLHKLERLALIMNELRPIKHGIEIEQIQTAINITHKAFERVLKFIKPGVTEYQIEAEITHEFLWNRATRHAYNPIIASGKNACILHYNDNNQPCADGDLVLMDFGAEYANYAADFTRTIPVNGKFAPRQGEVYQSVLNILKEARKMLVPGNNLEQYHKNVGFIVEAELIKLGLLNENDVKNQDPARPLYKKYFMHGTSHYLGLDVHDLGSKYRIFEKGMVFTCEPGIYIKEENMGIRLENNILITEDANVDLMQQLPLEISEIESIMA